MDRYAEVGFQQKSFKVRMVFGAYKSVFVKVCEATELGDEVLPLIDAQFAIT